MAGLRIKFNEEYSSIYNNKKTGFTTAYFTVGEAKEIYPNGMKVAGQIGCGDKEIGVVTDKGIGETVYKTTATIRYKTVGYIELDNGQFLAVKKDILAMLILLALLVLLLIMSIVFGVGYAIKTGLILSPDDNAPTTTAPYVLDADQQPGLGELELPSQVDVSAAKITATGVTELKFKAGQTSQSVRFTNSVKNTGICFMTFALYIDVNKDGNIDSGDELIYESNLVQPGYSITNITLNRGLEAGNYQVILAQNPYSFDQERNLLNNMNVVVPLTVE